MTPATKRSWFRPRYSLATLFVVVTVVGCWLGVQVKWIKDRREFLAQPGVAHYSKEQLASPAYPHVPIEPTAAPGLLRLFGDEGVAAVIVQISSDRLVDARREREAKRLFPEAHVSYAGHLFPEAEVTRWRRFGSVTAYDRAAIE